MIIKSIIKFCCCWLKYALFYSITLSFHNYFFHFLQMMYSSIKRASKLKFKNKNKTAAEFTQQTVYHATLLKDKTSWNTLCSMRADGKRYCFSRNSHNHGRHSSKPILTTDVSFYLNSPDDTNIFTMHVHKTEIKLGTISYN